MENKSSPKCMQFVVFSIFMFNFSISLIMKKALTHQLLVE